MLNSQKIKFLLTSNIYRYNSWRNDDNILISRLANHKTINNQNLIFDTYNDFQKENLQSIIKNNTSNKVRKSLNYKQEFFFNYTPGFLRKYHDSISYFEGSPSYDIYENALYLPQYKCLYLLDNNNDQNQIVMLKLDRELRQETKETKEKQTSEIKKIVKQNLTNIGRVNQTVIYGGHVFLNHYGHFLTEGFSRLWYSLLLESQQYPILVDFPLPSEIRKKKTYIDIFYEALSIDTKRFTSILQATIFKKIIVPSQSMGLSYKGAYEVHKLMPENVAYKLIEENLVTTSQPLYLSRTKLKESASNRSIVNELKIENNLREAGCCIVYPETKTLKEQINLINKHETIIAISGSSLHTVLFNLSKNKKVVCLSDVNIINRALVYTDYMKNIESFYIGSLKYSAQDKKNSKNKNAIITCDVAITMDALKDIGIV